MRKIFHRYIFKEIAVSFIIILFILTFVLLMGRILQIMDLMINKGVSIFDVLKIIFFLLPYFMMFTIPIALLISTLIVIGRLSGDNEITALKSSGISLIQIYYPVAIASLITFMCTFVLGYFLVPGCNMATKRLLFKIVQQNANMGIKEKIFNAEFKNFIIYADNVPANKNYIEGVLIADKRITTEQNTIIAKKAFIVSDPESMTITLKLENGSIHTVSKDLNNYRKIIFNTYDLKLDLSTAFLKLDKAYKDTKEMTMTELLEKIKTPGLDDYIKRELAIEIHNKFSIPFTCIFFGLLALPLGMRSNRSVKARGFAVGLIVVCFYYLLRIGGEALAETGRIPVAIGVWTPNILLAIIGVSLFYISYKEISYMHMTDFLSKRLFLKN